MIYYHTSVAVFSSTTFDDLSRLGASNLWKFWSGRRAALQHQKVPPFQKSGEAVPHIWVLNQKSGVFTPPNHPIFLIGFSLIFTIHFGVPLFLETSIYLYTYKPGSSKWPGNGPLSNLFGAENVTSIWWIKSLLWITWWCSYLYNIYIYGRVPTYQEVLWTPSIRNWHGVVLFTV